MILENHCKITSHLSRLALGLSRHTPHACLVNGDQTHNTLDEVKHQKQKKIPGSGLVDCSNGYGMVSAKNPARYVGSEPPLIHVNKYVEYI